MMDRQQQQRAFIRDCAMAMDTIAVQIEPCFGPLANDQLCLSLDGNRMQLVRSGSVLLGAMKFSKENVLERFLRDEIWSFQKRYGDGTTGLAIMLRFCLSFLSKQSGHDLLCMSQCLQQIRQVEFPSQILGLKAWDRKNIRLDRIVATHLSKEEPYCRELLLSWLRQQQALNENQDLTGILRAMLCSLEVGALVIPSYHSLEGPLVPSNAVILTTPPLLEMKGRSTVFSVSPIRFLVINCDLVPFHHQGTVVVESSKEFQHAIHFIHKRVNQIVEQLFHDTTLQVNVLISTTDLPDGILDVCGQYNIVAFQNVPKEQANLLCQFAGVAVVTNLYDDLLLSSDRHSSFVGEAESFVQIPLGNNSVGSMMTGIVKKRSAAVRTVHVTQLVIHALTETIFKQHRSAIERGLKLLLRWSEDPHGILILGGCAFELYLASRYLFSSHSASSPTMRFTHQMLLECLVNVAQKLAGKPMNGLVDKVPCRLVLDQTKIQFKLAKFHQEEEEEEEEPAVEPLCLKEDQFHVFLLIMEKLLKMTW